MAILHSIPPTHLLEALLSLAHNTFLLSCIVLDIVVFYLCYALSCYLTCRIQERPRPEYAARCTQFEKNLITGIKEPYFPPRERLPRILSGLAVIIMMVCKTWRCYNVKECIRVMTNQLRVPLLASFSSFQACLMFGLLFSGTIIYLLQVFQWKPAHKTLKTVCVCSLYAYFKFVCFLRIFSCFMVYFVVYNNVS